jgi:FtsH-binding integral membrane protein
MKRLWIPHAIPIVMLLWALNPENPYGYYVLLRFVCCACFAFIAFRYHDAGLSGWVWAFVVAALVYNPFFRVHLSREIWSVANIATVILASASLYNYKTRKE